KEKQLVAAGAPLLHQEKTLVRAAPPPRMTPPQRTAPPISSATASRSNATPPPAIPAAHTLSASTESPPRTAPAPAQPVHGTHCPTTGSGAAAQAEYLRPSPAADPQKAPVRRSCQG